MPKKTSLTVEWLICGDILKDAPQTKQVDTIIVKNLFVIFFTRTDGQSFRNLPVKFLQKMGSLLLWTAAILNFVIQTTMLPKRFSSGFSRSSYHDAFQDGKFSNEGWSNGCIWLTGCALEWLSTKASLRDWWWPNIVWIGHVRYINILTWFRGFRVKIVNFLCVFCLSIPKGDLDTKKTTPNIEASEPC